jgi:hypothetical protein
MDTKPEIFKLKKMRNERGYCLDDGTEIALDHRDELLSTLIHEVIHYLHPTWSEKAVLNAEKYIINHVTPKRAGNILKRLAKIL